MHRGGNGLIRRHLLFTALPFILLGHPSGSEAQDSAAKPIVIKRGGTYQGTWESLDPKVPAVTIATGEPVIIENSIIRGRGSLIRSVYMKAKVTVRNSRGIALSPDRPVDEYRYPGRFLELEEFRSANIYNNELIGTSGMYFRDFRGNAERGDTIKILRNKVRNIDGRYSTGKGTFSDKEGQYRFVQFVQFNAVRNIPNVEIAWNEVINEPGKSRPEEVINMYMSSGTPSSPIKIHHNYIQGAYNVNPERTPYNGAGMNLGDGSAKSVREAAAYIHAYYNQVISTNSGIVIAAGHDIKAYDNRIISSGYLPNGKLIFGQNVGSYVWDAYGDIKRGTFFNNSTYNNTIGWAQPKSGKNAQNNLWVPDCAKNKTGKSLCSGNVFIKGTVTQDMEKAEMTRWQTRLKKAKINIGVSGTIGRAK